MTKYADLKATNNYEVRNGQMLYLQKKKKSKNILINMFWKRIWTLTFELIWSPA